MIDGWATTAGAADSAPDYALGANYTIPNTDVTLYAVWATDSDGDGYSDTDETNAGSDPYDPNSGPINRTVSYDENGGSGSASNVTGFQGSTIDLYDGDGFLKDGFVISGWSEVFNPANDSIPNYLLGETYTIPTSDVILYVVWATDTDKDGYSDTDEVVLGSNPNDASSIPAFGNITGIIQLSDDSYVSGYIVRLNSIPQTATTDENGAFSFMNVPLTNHTLTVSNGGGPLGKYSIVYSSVPNNPPEALVTSTTSASIATNGSAYALNLGIKPNQINVWELIYANIGPLSSGIITNPKTGDTTYYNWLFAVFYFLLVTIIFSSNILLSKNYRENKYMEI